MEACRAYIRFRHGIVPAELRACLSSLFQSRAREEAVGFGVQEPRLRRVAHLRWAVHLRWAALPYGRGAVQITIHHHPLRGADPRTVGTVRGCVVWRSSCANQG